MMSMCFSVILSVLRQGNCPPTIPLNDARLFIVNSNLGKPSLHPFHLLSTPGHRNIFGFDSGKGYRGLALAAPGDWGSYHSKNITRG